MSKQKIYKTLSWLCVAAITVTMVAGCGRKKDEVSHAEVDKILIPVKAVVAQKRDVTQTLNFSGNIDAFQRAAIAPALAGARVLKIYAEEGQQVREGQILARMEDFQLQQTAAQIEQLKAQLAQMDVEYKRISTLHSRGSATQQQYDQLKTQYESLKSGLDAANAGYAMLQKSVELRAPFSGTIIGRYVNEGDMYMNAPGYDGTIGILSIAQMGRMKIEIMVPEQDFVLLRPGQIANIRVDAYHGEVFEGKIFTVNPALNRISRTSRVVIEIKNDKQNRMLKPGMFARVEIVTNKLNDVLAVPSTAIVQRAIEGQDEKLTFPHVFTVENGTAPFDTKPKLVPVTIGMVTNEFTQILEGIEEGTVVLTDNNVSLVESTGIRVTEVR